MEFNIKTCAVETVRTDCLILGVYEGRRLPPQSQLADKAAGGALLRALRAAGLTGRLGQTLAVGQLPGLGARQVLAVGCGAKKDLDSRAFTKALDAAYMAARSLGAQRICLCLTALEVSETDTYWRLRRAVEIGRHAAYQFDTLKTSKPKPDRRPGRVNLVVTTRAEVRAGQDALLHGVAVADGVDMARDLANLPSNICTPTYLATRARALATGYRSLEVSVMGEAGMRRAGMGALLSVARGSEEPAKLISIQYRGGRKGERPVVLVGKGVTFDSGGISIKPSAAMDEMKFDMCGAASVIGTLKAVAEIGLPANVVGIIPATENLPSGSATKPGDVVTSMAGTTIEVLNTDAEGRLILSDALTYAERFDPDVVVDIATLTGACVVALGAHATGLFSNHKPLADALSTAGESTGDRAWEMPLWDEYQSQLRSNFADVANIGGRNGGAITAACFLARFAKDYRWAHLDIAGTAWRQGARKGATGRPVPLLTQFLLDRTKKASPRRKSSKR